MLMPDETIDVIGGVGLAAVKSDLSGNIAVCWLSMPQRQEGREDDIE